MCCTQITATGHDDAAGLFAAGDSQGVFALWEVYDSVKGEGVTARLRQARALNAGESVDQDNEDEDDEADEDSGDEGHSCSDEGEGEGEGEKRSGDENSRRSPPKSPKSRMMGSGTVLRPNGVHKVFQGSVGSKVTALLPIADAASIYVGTEEGDVYVCEDFNLENIVQVHIGRLESSLPMGSVLGLHYSSFYYSQLTLPVVYVIFSSGYVAVVSTETCGVIAFSPGPNGSDENDETDPDDEERNLKRRSRGLKPIETPRVVVACVVDAKNNPVTKPDPSIKLNVGRKERARTTSSGSNSATSKSSAWSKLVGAANTGTAKKGDKIVAVAVAVRVPKHGPRSLLVVAGKCLFTYDLSKFAHLSGDVFTAPHANSTTSMCVSKTAFVAASVVTYVEEAARAYGIPAPCFSCLDAGGSISVISVKTQKVITSTRLLEGLAGDAELRGGAVLPSGNCYMLENEFILLSANFVCKTHRLGCTLPARTPTHVLPPREQLQLLTGREEPKSGPKDKMKKRKSLFSGAVSTAFDLDKVLSKTKAQTTKDELVSGAVAGPSGGGGTAQGKKGQAAAAGVMGTASELGDALQQRGERMNRVALKMEKFKEDAQEYSKNTQAYTAKLKEKNKAWGLGFF